MVKRLGGGVRSEADGPENDECGHHEEPGLPQSLQTRSPDAYWDLEYAELN